nr:uncharacterized protein LOC111508016 [Leptinotarsa decemlineata]
MALERKNFKDIPTDAIVLTEEQALVYQTKILNNWSVPADVFGFKYGSFFLGGATMFVGIYINNFFRWKFKLMHYGRFVSYLPMAAIPASLTVLLHQEVVLKDLVLKNQDTCPVCLQTRAAALQAAVGCVFPLLIAPISSLTLVNRYKTYDIPYISREPMKIFRLIQKMIKPKQNILFGIFIAQALFGSIVTYLEAESIYKVNSKLLELTASESEVLE